MMYVHSAMHSNYGIYCLISQVNFEHVSLTTIPFIGSVSTLLTAIAPPLSRNTLTVIKTRKLRVIAAQT